jgi:hypothetical protein
MALFRTGLMQETALFRKRPCLEHGLVQNMALFRKQPCSEHVLVSEGNGLVQNRAYAGNSLV